MTGGAAIPDDGPLHLVVTGGPVPHAYVHSATASGGTAILGLMDTVSVISVSPESHPHDQAHEQPLATVEGSGMVVAAGLTAAGAWRVRHHHHGQRPQPGYPGRIGYPRHAGKDYGSER